MRWGKDEGTFNIHGALWPPEVSSLGAAMNYSNELVAREIERCPYPVDRVLDLGCGVGGSLFYLGRRLPRVRSFTGVSLSPVQIKPRAAADSRNPEGPVSFRRRLFFAAVGRAVSGRLFLCHRSLHPLPGSRCLFRCSSGRVAARRQAGHHRRLPERCLSQAARSSRPASRLLDDYRRNWLLPGLRDLAALKSLAEEKGFHLIKDRNLTPYLRLGRPRDQAIALLVRFLGPLMERDTYLRSLVGGDAKQKCYREGLIHYRLLVFENQSADAGR